MRTPKALRHAVLAVLVTLAVIAASACNTKAEDACESVGACEEGGSTEYIKACQEEARLLLITAERTGCDGFYNVYYRCAVDNYMCEGATASFPGCEPKRVNLDDCLAKGREKIACGELDVKTARCHTVDAGDGPIPISACTAAHECAARCYLDNVVDVCAPRSGELTAVASCTNTCPR